ncbi:MAG: hypothetical protein CL693_08230 [Cellvibrionaceae bacterium]|nr:hypothetical protein [Cellvibrionaceae bacterium]|tara:strand:- start:33950 stop:34870 length:921 start_codon:yes stop_codon:yes gene_type:complete
MKLRLPLRVFCDNNFKGNDVELIAVDRNPSDKLWGDLSARSGDVDSQGQPKTICVVVLDDGAETGNPSPSRSPANKNTFTTKANSRLATRWFQGTREIQLCGSALAATSYALERHLGMALLQKIHHQTTQVELCTAERAPDSSNGSRSSAQPLYGFSMPRTKLQVDELPVAAIDWFGVPITQALSTENEKGYWVLEVSDPLEALTPNFGAISASTDRAIILTTTVAAQKPSVERDYSLRYFAPQYGIDEDIATGSANAIAACYWGEKLNKNRLIAEQIPANHSGGRFYLTLDSHTVKVYGEVREES